MTIDAKQSFRKGSVIVEIHADTSTAPCQHCLEMEQHQETCIMMVGLGRSEVVHTTFVRKPTDYGTINKAKKANRLTQYRTIPHKEARRKVNGVWVS